MTRRKKELNLTIKEFDPKKQLKPDRNILIVGAHGKSHLLKAILANMSPVPFAVLVNPNEFANGLFGQILPDQCKIDELSDTILEKMCERQKTLCKYMRDHPSVKLDPRAFLIMDDCVPDFIDLKWAKNPHFKFLFRSGRPAHLGTIFTSPYPLPIPAHFLPHIDYVFILKEGNVKNRRKLWDQFGGMFDDFKIFDKVMQMSTKNYTALVIDRTKTTDKLDQRLFYYKAPETIPKFHLGCSNLWNLCYQSDLTFHDLLADPFEIFQKTETSRR